MLMAPSYISVLNVYAFANVHDVSWGTKGDNKVSTDLGVVKTGKDSNQVEAVVPDQQNDIDANYEDALHVLRTKPAKVESKPDAATQQEDYYRSFRTNVLLAWTLSNGLLAAAVVFANAKAGESGANKSVQGYMTFLLYSVAGLACEFFSCFSFFGRVADNLFVSSREIHRVNVVHGHQAVCWRVRVVFWEREQGRNNIIYRL